MCLHQLFSSKMFSVLGQVQWRWQHQELYCSPDGLSEEWGTALSVLGHKRKDDFKSNDFSSSLYELAAQTAARAAPCSGPRTIAQGQDMWQGQQEPPGAMAFPESHCQTLEMDSSLPRPSLPFLLSLGILIQWASVTYAFFLKSKVK